MDSTRAQPEEYATEVRTRPPEWANGPFGTLAKQKKPALALASKFNLPPAKFTNLSVNRNSYI